MQGLYIYEKCEGVKWCEICKDCKNLSDCCKECDKIYEDCKCCLEYVKPRKKHFTFACSKCQ